MADNPFDNDNPLGISSVRGSDDDIGRLFGAASEQEDEDIRELFGSSPSTASANVKVSRDTNPDQYVEHQNIGAKLGLPTEAVSAAPDEAKLAEQDSDLDILFGNSPATQRFYENVENARVAHDAVEELSVVESLTNGLRRGGLRVRQNLDQFVAEESATQTKDMERSFSEILSDENKSSGSPIPNPLELLSAVERWASSRVFGSGEEAAKSRFADVRALQQRIRGTPMSREAADFASRVQTTEGFLSKLGEAASDPVGLASFAAEVGVEFLPQLVAGGLATAASRNPVFGAAIMGTLSGATERYSSPAEFLESAGVDLSDPSQIDALISDPELLKQAQNFGFTRGSIIGAVDAFSGGIAGRALANNPIADIFLQTGVQATLGGVGEAGAQVSTVGVENLNSSEIILEAVGELATTPIEVSAVGGRSLLPRVRDMLRRGKSEANLATMDEVRQSVQQSKLAARSPSKAAEHLAETFGEQSISEVYIAADDLQTVATQTGDPESFYANLGVRDQIENATAFNGDVRIPARAFAEHVMLTDRYEAMRDFIKVDPEGVSTAEAREQEESRELDLAEREVSRDTTEDATVADASPEAVEDVELAEHEAGLQALFKTADEAGLTEKQYASYITAIKDSKQAAVAAKERRRLKRLQKRNDEQYQKKASEVRERVAESLSQEPLYQAQLAIGRDRLNRDEVLEALNGDKEALKQLPKVNGRSIVAPEGEKGISPRVLADLYGFEGGDILVYNFLDNPSFEEAVRRRTETEMEKEFPTLLSRREGINEALEALHESVGYADTLAYELNRMRAARGMKKLRKSLIKTRAQRIVQNFKLSDINVRQLEATQRREARRARKGVRAGDLDTAAQAKLNQIVAFEMTKEAYAIKDEVARGNKFMKKFTGPKKAKFKDLPVDSYNAIRDLLADYNLGPRLTNAKRKSLEEFVEQKFREEGVIVQMPDRILREDRTTNFQDLTLSEWRSLRDTVRAIHKSGLDENKLLRAEEKSSRQQIADEIASRIKSNIKARPVPLAGEVTEVTDVSRADTMMQRIREAKDRYGVDATTILLNTDSLLRAVDGFEDLGTAYTYIKGGIDRAITEGYQPGQSGYVARLKQESEKLIELFDSYTKREKADLNTQQDIPGVRQRLTKMQQIAVVLNMGNADNVTALLEGRGRDGSPQFTEAELQAILDNQSKRDLDFVQGVWDYLENLWPEVKETVKRRQNRDVLQVEAAPLETKHGTYRGGYYPLRYNSSEAVVEGNVTAEDAKQKLLNGGVTSMHTRNNHTKERKGSGGRPVLLDPSVLNSHVQQVVYDLEVGDAVLDAYKILHHKDVKNAFGDAGRKEMWDALDLWLGDVTTGEMQRPGIVEAGLRRIRTGTTISALAFNFSVSFLQPLGLIQSSVQVGKKYVMGALWDITSLPMRNGGNPKAVYDHLQWVTSQSGFMRERERSFNKDVMEAQRGLKTGWLARNTPGRTTEYATDAMFLFIAKAQRMVDYVTWVAGYKRGLDEFNGDHAKAVQLADRSVARSQGSGNFQERTGFERGTINSSIRQTETVKAWSLFLNYFAAKMNVAYERTKQTRFSNPLDLAHWATDMALLFAVEGFLANLIREGLPSEDDEESLWGIAAYEGVKGFAAGVPLVREVVSSAEGFATGGSAGSFFTKAGDVAEQIGQGELDVGLAKSVNNVLGVLFKYPTSQVHKTGGAILKGLEGEDVEAIEYIMGPKYEE